VQERWREGNIYIYIYIWVDQNHHSLRAPPIITRGATEQMTRVSFQLKANPTEKPPRNMPTYL